MNLKPHFFLRTYVGDRDWLPYLTRSLAKHAPDIGLTVVAPEGQNIGVPYQAAVTPHSDDYINQQYSKLYADTFVPDDVTHIVHIDSDCLLTKSIGSLFVEGKPLMLHTPWDQVGDAVAWKEPTERLLGFEAPYEFMRRHPLVYPVEVYEALRDYIETRHKTSLFRLVSGVKNRNLSEFNLLGSFCYKFFPNRFHWINTSKEPLPEPVARQGWSWGGIEKVKDEWEALLA